MSESYFENISFSISLISSPVLIATYFIYLLILYRLRIGLTNQKYANVQHPKMMKAPFSMELRASWGTPVKMWVILQPPPTAAPKPMRQPPKNVWISTFGAGARNLASPAILAPIKEPRMVESNITDSQPMRFSPISRLFTVDGVEE